MTGTSIRVNSSKGDSARALRPQRDFSSIENLNGKMHFRNPFHLCYMYLFFDIIFVSVIRTVCFSGNLQCIVSPRSSLCGWINSVYPRQYWRRDKESPCFRPQLVPTWCRPGLGLGLNIDFLRGCSSHPRSIGVPSTRRFGYCRATTQTTQRRPHRQAGQADAPGESPTSSSG